MEYYKSLQPTQLIAERGPEVVVINPGSSNLRIGLASWQMPVVVPHWIAWYMPGKVADGVDVSSKKGAVGEQMAQQPDYRTNRDETCLRVESMLGIRSSISKDTDDVDVFKDETLRGGYDKCEPEGKLSEVQWTQVLSETSVQQLGITKTGGDDTPLKASSFRRYICGEEALRIPATQPYCLRRPMCRGRLNISQQYSLQQVCDDLHAIWNWALSEKLSIDRKTRRNLSAVLVVPDTFDNREVKELLSVLLRDLEFQSVVVHQECVAATFGNGVSSACVVQLGAQVTSITCVEDGVSISMTHRVLPYGGEDISRCLLWVQQRHENWPPISTDPSTDPLDLVMLNRLKETHCVVTTGERVATAEVSSFTAGKPAETYRVTLVAVNVPPLGLFYPSLLAPEEHKPFIRPWYYTDHEDMLVDPGETGMWNQNPANGNELVVNGRNSSLSSSGDSLLGLHEAIVNSILSMGRLDLKTKFFSSILLVGGVASTPGIVDFLEDKIIHSIPGHEVVDRVEALPNRIDPSMVCWKGGVILGILDFSRDVWIQRDDWKDGGPRVGSSRKYKDSISLHAQAFWYNAVLE